MALHVTVVHLLDHVSLLFDSVVSGEHWILRQRCTALAFVAIIALLGIFLRSKRPWMMFCLLLLITFTEFLLFQFASPSPWWRHPQGYHANAGVLKYVNPKIGTLGYSPNGNGCMVPSVAPPFGMTRWVPQTRENYISQVPYSDGDTHVHGFQATHQPAIWMGESGQVVLCPGVWECPASV